MTPLLYSAKFSFRINTMTHRVITNHISKWPQTIHTKLPVGGLDYVVDPHEGTVTLAFTSLEFTKTHAAKLVLKGDDFDRQKYAELIRAMSAPNTMLEYVSYLGDFKYEAMVVLQDRFVPIRFVAGEATLLWNAPDTDDREVSSVLEHYRTGGWVRVFAGVLPYWPDNYYARPRIDHPRWKWVRERNPNSQHPYPHIDSEMRLVCIAPDPDDEGFVEQEITQSDWADAVAMRKIRESIVAGGYGRYRSPSLDEYESIAWLGRYGVFDLHWCGNNVIAGTMGDTGETIFETVQLGTRNPFAPEWYWEALTRICAIDKNARDYYFNLRNCKN